MIKLKLKIQELGELLVSLCYQPIANRLTVVVLKARNLPKMDLTGLCGKWSRIRVSRIKNTLTLQFFSFRPVREAVRLPQRRPPLQEADAREEAHPQPGLQWKLRLWHTPGGRSGEYFAAVSGLWPRSGDAEWADWQGGHQRTDAGQSGDGEALARGDPIAATANCRVAQAEGVLGISAAKQKEIMVLFIW